MSKLTLNAVLVGYQSNLAINVNNGLIEAAMENTLSLDGTSPNQMQADFDLNNNNLLNVATINGISVTLLTDLGATVTLCQGYATTASASAAAAAISETNAATSETNAGLSASSAATSAGNAATSETNAGLSAGSASISESNAATSASNASTSESNASTSETNAAASALAASGSASSASTDAGTATTQAGIATTQASNASTSASNAATSETNAATSATNAYNSEVAAAASAASVGITLGTPVATTSGTSVEFTGIPSGIKRITLMVAGISNSIGDNWLIQIGSGSYTTSGYYSAESNITAVVSTNNSTTGISFRSNSSAIVHGAITFYLLDSSTNTWVASGVMARSNTGTTETTAGSVSISGALDRIKLTTVTGTDTFTAGSINIMYEK
jgi:hypothetical protein